MFWGEFRAAAEELEFWTSLVLNVWTISTGLLFAVRRIWKPADQLVVQLLEAALISAYWVLAAVVLTPFAFAFGLMLYDDQNPDWFKWIVLGTFLVSAAYTLIWEIPRKLRDRFNKK